MTLLDQLATPQGKSKTLTGNKLLVSTKNYIYQPVQAGISLNRTDDDTHPLPGVNSIDLVRTYLREIGRIPLLSQEQEILYGKQVQEMMPLLQAKQALASILRREPTLRQWALHLQLHEVHLTEVVRHGQRAKQKMIEANLRLVVSIAKKYQRWGLELLDLIQEGTLGLERAVEKFDPTKGYRFSTYAYWWIRQAITRVIGEQGRTIRLPIHIIEKLNKIKKARRHLSQTLGRLPTLTEVAAELELTPQQLREYLQRSRRTISLDVRVGLHRDTDLSELIEDPRACPEEFVMQSQFITELEPLLAELSPQQREVLELRFGLRDKDALSLAATGRLLQLSRERVRQIEKIALKELRSRCFPLEQAGEKTSSRVSCPQSSKAIAEAELSAFPLSAP